MGAHPYYYFVPYQDDIADALESLRRREFLAGRYNPAMPFPPFPVDPSAPAPGAQHASIQDAFADADADGTRSILDLVGIGDEPDFGTAAFVGDGALESLYGTNRPTRAMVEANMDFFGDMGRGQGIFFVVYKDGKPDEILFAGYSYD
jgi:hypothetical protein